jgi:hypothetical protein
MGKNVPQICLHITTRMLGKAPLSEEDALTSPTHVLWRHSTFGVYASLAAGMGCSIFQNALRETKMVDVMVRDEKGMC